ncbi:MAG: type II toxin-antitoxin system VapC family toxin [Thermodesulfobacteriota bacterium]|nr:type II toxin-antitoxin system VapC family toxin [Thermodesulfobacteriota bacterium]
MIAVDTNVIIRLLTQDDNEQFKKAKNFLKKNEIFVPDTVLLETEWVLRFAYDFNAQDISSGLRKFLGLPNVHVQNVNAAAQALEWHDKGLDFADAFHLALSQHCTGIATFDRKFRKTAKDLQSCFLQEP